MNYAVVDYFAGEEEEGEDEGVCGDEDGGHAVWWEIFHLHCVSSVYLPCGI